MRVFVLLTTILLLNDITASAQTPPQVLVGAGAQSCGEWLAVVDKGEKRDELESVKFWMMTSWVQGFVVGSATQLTVLLAGSPIPNLATLQARNKTVSGWVFDPPDSHATEYWITKFCRDNPLEPINNASEGLVADLFTKK